MDVVARLVSDLVNPVLVLLAIAAPWAPRKRDEGPLQFWAGCFAAIVIASSIAENGKTLSIWPGHPTFPSGHESFGAAAATCLICYDRDWAWLVVPILVLFGWALVTAGYHDPEDIYGAIVLGPASALIARLAVSTIWRKFRSRRSQNQNL